ncbi:MAG: hypothetical protein QX191_03290 [Methylococcaceae bacterium]
MNKQKLNEPSAHKEDGVEKRRRFIKGAGLAAPVVLSLANRSAFGAAAGCLSQQVSGNVSQAGAGSCSSGSSVGSWNPSVPRIGTSKFKIVKSSSQPSDTNAIVTATWEAGGKTYILTANITQTSYQYNWIGTPYVYGILTTQSIEFSLTRDNAPRTSSFTFPASGVTTNPAGSTLFTTLFPSASTNYSPTTTYYTYISNPATGALTKTTSAGVSGVGSLSRSYFSGGTAYNDSTAFSGSSITTSLRANLSVAGLNANSVAALLNAVYTPASTPPYVLTVEQVKGLCATPPTEKLPPNTTLTTFLASTFS